MRRHWPIIGHILLLVCVLFGALAATLAKADGTSTTTYDEAPVCLRFSPSDCHIPILTSVVSRDGVAIAGWNGCNGPCGEHRGNLTTPAHVPAPPAIIGMATGLGLLHLIRKRKGST